MVSHPLQENCARFHGRDILEAISLNKKCGAGGGSRTLTGLLSPADFLTDYGFRRPDAVSVTRFAVWTIPSPYPGRSGA